MKKGTSKKIEIKGGIRIEFDDFIKCHSYPAIGYAKERKRYQGGPVCPDVSNYTTVIEGNFAQIRQFLVNLELKKRGIDWKTLFRETAGKLIPDLEEYLDKKGYTEKEGVFYDQYLKSLIKRAREIKRQAQLIWTLNSAINFAVANCNCGRSFCEFPVCVSGLPLTPEVLNNGYCYVVYIFRAPLKHALIKLERILTKY